MRLAAHPGNDAPAFAWEECACLLCGGVRLTPLLEAPDTGTGLRFLIVRCNLCGLVFTNPRPDVDSIEQFYPANYRCHQVKDSSGKRDPFPRLLPAHGQARLLDFGCGAGDFLARMNALGWNVTGLDASEIAVERVRQRFGLPAHVGTLPCSEFGAASFDAITMRQSLEHTHEPLEVLEAAQRVLAPGGRLLVSVPNYDCFASTWFGVDWYGLDVPRHLTHFTPRTLRRMLKRAGFARISIRQHTRVSWIRHSARKANAPFLATRLGSTLTAFWGRFIGKADCLLAMAIKN
jgi:SAM-dependent methyltransferase